MSMGFERSGIDERPAARAVSDFVRSEHVEVSIDPDAVVAELADAAWFFDDLFGDWGTVTTRILYRRCREMGIKVVLVGEGSDELFGGFPVFVYTPGGPLPLRLFLLYRRYAGRRYGRQFWAFQRTMRGHLAETGGDWFQAVRLVETRSTTM
ncbi:MAG TPA: asparagine synthase-related protein [Longimicrobiales bacterium]|nr:asparagine synthase-related protein [Longimicrobiales bacterium]